ncbi:MAG: HU family DNA-binding protein [Waterburya sp.]
MKLDLLIQNLERKLRAEGITTSEKALRKIVDKLFELIREEMLYGGSIQIKNFGKFESRYRKARETVHPRTQEQAIFAARISPYLKYSQNFKKAFLDKTQTTEEVSGNAEPR